MTAYRILLLLYPASFRGRYGEELCGILSRRLRHASSTAERFTVWFDAIIDLVLSAVQAHWDIFRQDVRYLRRTLSKSAGFAVTAICVVALGVGATTAAYTIADYVLIRQLPFPDSERLVKLWEDMSPGGYVQMEPSPANYLDWKRLSKSFSGMAASRGLSVGLAGAGEPEQLEGAAVTADLLPMLGARPALGRLFAADDDRPNAAGTAVISYGFWQHRFAGDSEVVGRRILLDGAPYLVIGVMQRDFAYPERGLDLWTTMRFVNSDFEDRNDNYLRVVAKLRSGVSIDQARAEMRIISDELRRLYPRDNEHVGVRVDTLRDEIPGRARLLLLALLAASFCVLLIACTNLANLLLARALIRRKEIAVRAALGAGRERLVRQMLTENLLLALGGGTLGMLLATAAVPVLAKFVPDALPASGVPSMDGRILVFSLLLTIGTGICFGVLPAARAARADMVGGLQEGGRQGIGGRREGMRSALVITEVAISLMLLISCGLLIRALWQLEQRNPGFEPQNVLTMRTALPMPKYASTARRVKFYTAVLTAVRRIPGVVNAGYTSFLPIVLQGGIWPVTIAGQPENVDRAFDSASLRFATPGFFEAMRIPLLRGRRIEDSDTEKSQYVAVVSESFVHKYWPDENPIGHQFRFGYAIRTVIGVVANVRVRGLERSSEPQVYLPYKQVPDDALVWYAPKDLAIRYVGSGGALVADVRRIITDVDPEQPVSDVQTLSDILNQEMAPRVLQLRVLAGFAGLALLLAGIGIHGLLSFAVSNRSQEIGIRVAIGARPKDVLAMILHETFVLMLAGAAVGLVLAYAGARGLQGLLAGVPAGDSATYVTALAAIGLTGLVGSLWPAVRALQVDPMQVLRSE